MASGFKNKVKAVWAFIARTAVKVFNYLKVAKMEWIIMISVFILDLVAKSLVENFLAFNESVPMIPYFLNARKVHNYSAAFGSSWLSGWMGAIGARIFFCVFAVAASVAFILILIRNKGKSRVFRIAVALFVAGAMGNCIDRMALGYVRDFIEFEYFGLTIGGRTTWAYIFNIADVALVTGVILIVFYFLFLYKDNDSKKIEFSIDTEPAPEPVAHGEKAAVAQADGAAATETDTADEPTVENTDADNQDNIDNEIIEHDIISGENPEQSTESGGGDTD